MLRSAAIIEQAENGRHAQGRPAVTHYKLLKVFPKRGSLSLLECRLETGRTHQIRVHMAHIGHPLLGDGAYGKGFTASQKRLPSSRQAA